MNKTINLLIKDKISTDDVSVRKAAQQIGLAHTTLSRMISGEPYDLKTATKIARWLEVPLTSLLDASGIGDDALAAQISLVLQKEPKLTLAFCTAMDRVLRSEVSLDTYRDIIAFAAYRINLIDKDAVINQVTRSQKKDITS